MESMNTLQPFHFVTPPKPKKEDFRIWPNNPAKSTDITFGQGSPFEYNHTDFQKALSEWKSLYGDKEPEPEWKDLDDEKPNSEEDYVYLIERGKPVVNIITGKLHKRMLTKHYIENWGHFVDKWAYAESFDTLHSEWKYHQVRYKGWTLSTHSVNHPSFYKGDCEVYFDPDDKLSIILPKSKHDFDFIPSTEWFELTLKESGITP